MSDRPPPVTVVAHEVGTPGGMERQLGVLVTGLLDRGHEVTVVAGACALGERQRLRWVRVPGPRRPFSLWYAWFFLLGSLVAWRRRDGILHTTGAVVFNRADVSTVHFCHRAFHSRRPPTRARNRSAAYLLNAWASGLMSRAAERLCYRPRATRRLVAVSQGVAGELREHFPSMAGRVEVIPNGVDHSAFAPDAHERARLRASWGMGEGELVALFVGGDWQRKGLNYAIEGVAKAPGWHLVVVGPGDAEGYRAFAERAGAGGRVRFEGAAQDTAPYYAAADAFVLPTAYETFSLVTFEAAAAGLPLLVTRVSGVDEILIAGRNGQYIDRDGEVIADNLEALGSDEGLRRAMGEAARSDSARFDWARAVDAYSDLYAARAP